MRLSSPASRLTAALRAACAAAALAAGAAASAQTQAQAPPLPPSPAPPAAPPTAAGAEAPARAPGEPIPVAASDLTSLNRLLPVGKTARRVTVPTVDAEGRLTSVASFGSVTRIDEDTFFLEKVVLTSFDPALAGGPTAPAADPPPEETVIRLIDGRYHASTRVLVSDKRVTMHKPTVFVSGSSLHYDCATGRAKMGPTYTLITESPRPVDGPGEEDADDSQDDLESDGEDEPHESNENTAPTADP